MGDCSRPGIHSPSLGFYDPVVDEIAVQRALAGSPPRLTAREIEAALRLADNGSRSTSQVADLIKVSTRTVCRHRARRKKEADYAGAPS